MKTTPKCFSMGSLFPVFLTKCLLKCHSSTNPLPLTWNISGGASALRHYSFCKTLHLEYLTVFWMRLCLDNCSVICTVTLCYVLHQTHSEFWHIHHSVFFFFFFSGICWHIQLYSPLLRHIRALLGIFRFTQAYSALCTTSHIHNLTIFRTGSLFKTMWNVNQVYLEPCQRALFNHIQAYSEPCETLTSAETWHIWNPGISRTWHIFRNPSY